jgi:acyl-CoA synthetase (AMP-forming)/AMP-acid ligase II
LQCTSGSTGLPKGVALSHGNLLANVEQIGLGVEATAADVVVSWLPLNHDMGIIGCLLFAIYWGMDLVLQTPSRFLRRPSTWVRTIAEYRGTLSPAPNFAYGYLTARVRPDEIDGIDLSSWRVAFCGAEPIDAGTMRKFEECFAHYRLRPSVILPCYGLAEASLAVTFHAWGTPLETDLVDRDALGAEGRAEPGASLSTSTEIVCCGAPLPGTEVKIVDAEGAPLEERRIGRILVRGPSVMRGYYQLPERTAEVLSAGWLDTGDLGYLCGGKLFVTGREKDVVIIRGKCYAPTEFEWAAGEVDGVREGAAVAFGIFDPQRGTELLHLVCEAETSNPAERSRLRDEVMARVAARTGIRPDIVHFVRRYAIPKTTSGKLQRAKTKQMYLEERPSRSWRIF